MNIYIYIYKTGPRLVLGFVSDFAPTDNAKPPNDEPFLDAVVETTMTN